MPTSHFRRAPRVSGLVAGVTFVAALTACAPTDGTTTSGGDKAAENSRSTAPGAKSSKTAAPTKPAKSGKPSDGGWVVESYQFKNDGLGDFGGTARLTNTKGETRNGIFTITVFKAGKQVASLQGSASDVESGKTVTVQLISSDKYVAGPYTIDFQNDL
jgi:hypothetical protein